MPILPPTSAPVPVETKSGVKTSEFWMSALAQVVALVGQYSGAIPPPYGVIASVVLTAVYTIARALTKSNAATAGAASSGGASVAITTTEKV